MISIGARTIPKLIEFFSWSVDRGANILYFLPFRLLVRRHHYPCGGVMSHFLRSRAEKATRARVERSRRGPAVY